MYMQLNPVNKIDGHKYKRFRRPSPLNLELILRHVHVPSAKVFNVCAIINCKIKNYCCGRDHGSRYGRSGSLPVRTFQAQDTGE